MLICIVGKSGSGKSYISNIIKKYNESTVYLDVDKIAHKVLELEEVKEQLLILGDILTSNKIDRKKLGYIVFNNERKMKYLKEVTWYYMEKIIDKIIKKNKDKIIILDYLFLKETKYFNKSDLNILVDAPFNIRLERATKRDNITKEQFMKRDYSYQLNEEGFDYIIENVDKEKTKKKVSEIYDKSIIHR